MEIVDALLNAIIRVTSFTVGAGIVYFLFIMWDKLFKYKSIDEIEDRFDDHINAKMNDKENRGA